MCRAETTSLTACLYCVLLSELTQDRFLLEWKKLSHSWWRATQVILLVTGVKGQQAGWLWVAVQPGAVCLSEQNQQACVGLKLSPSFYCLRSSIVNEARPKFCIIVLPTSHFNDNPLKSLPDEYYGLLTRRFKASLARQLA